ncbi:hypothetical protein Tco_0291360, partial [Tanacetum coccineum]
TVGETKKEYKPATIEEKQDRRNEMKARGTLLMALPNKDQLKFYSYTDAKFLMEAIEKSQLEIQGKVNTQEDMNLKILRSLPSEWKTHDLIWRNKQEIETISLDDLYNNLKIYEPEISASSSTSQNLQNVAFVSSNSTNSNSNTNEADNTAYGVSSAHTQSNPTFRDNLSDAVNVNSSRGHAEAGCKWSRVECDSEKLPLENAMVAQDEWNGGMIGATKLEEGASYINFALIALKIFRKFFQFQISEGLESVEARLAHYKKNEAVFEESINVLNLEVKLRYNVLVENKKKLEKAEKEIDEFKLTLEKFQNSSKSLNNLLESQFIDKFKTGLGYNADSSTAASPAVKSFVNSSEIRFVPQEVLTKSSKINTAGASVNIAVRPVNTAGSKPTVNHPRPISNAYKKGYSQVTRPFSKYSEYKNSIFNKNVNTVRVKDTTARDRAVVSENKGKRVNVVKASACWVWKAKNSSASNTFKKYSYIDAQGRSKSIMAWIPKRV